MSTHQAIVHKIKLTTHPNSDFLSIVFINGYTVCVRTSEWQDGQLGVYVEPDYLVPANRPEFQFLEKTHKLIECEGVKGYRITLKRLRGVYSWGLLIPAPAGSNVGDNLLEQLGIIRYEPPLPATTRGEAAKAPKGVYPKYDVENAYNYTNIFLPDEELVCTEKVHGASSRYLYLDGEMHVGSRTEWKKNDGKIIWWKALENHPELEKFCVDNPGITVYGEVYGQVQDLTYGVQKGKILFIAFDLLRDGNWVNHDEAREIGKNLPWVPEVYRGKWTPEIYDMAECKSIVAKNNGVDQIAEGLVVKPLQERTNLEIGRVQLKIVSKQYFERKSH